MGHESWQRVVWVYGTDSSFNVIVGCNRERYLRTGLMYDVIKHLTSQK